MLLVLAALGLTALLLRQTMNPETLPAVSLGEVFQRNLIMTRVSLSVLLVVAWPFILHGAAEFLKLRFKQTDRFLTLSALFLSALTYVMTFLPGYTAAASLLVPVVVAPFLFRAVLRMSWGQVTSLWATQLLSLSLLMCFATWGLESAAIRLPLNPRKELPVIFSLLTAPDNANPPLYCAADGKSFPAFHWESSGSEWLDLRANQAQIIAVLGERPEDWVITLQDVTHDINIDQSRHSISPWRSVRFNPGPDFNHVIRLNTTTRKDDFIQIYSLLRLTTIN